MSTLTITILGLNRVGASVGLALKRYVKKGGKYRFDLVGHDFNSDNEKQALKMGAVDRVERKPFDAVRNADLVVLGVSYEDVEETYRSIRGDLRDGVVILDASPLKTPSLDWAKKHLKPDHHLVGITPILNPRYLFKPEDDLEQAQEDLFDDSTILLTPSVVCIKEAVDLAFNFCQILGSKPRFLDPLEHDAMLSQTVQLPRLLGTALFYSLMNRQNWNDIKWFTNPAFGVLTRPLFDIHPDALRDEFAANADTLARALDSYIATLQEFSASLKARDVDAIEAAVVSASKEYESWINSRYRADWDSASKPAEPGTSSFMQGLLGSALADRLSGKKDDK
jgi:prephenate dehydrogenase